MHKVAKTIAFVGVAITAVVSGFTGHVEGFPAVLTGLVAVVSGLGYWKSRELLKQFGPDFWKAFSEQVKVANLEVKK